MALGLHQVGVRKKPFVILIGPIADDPTESVSVVNRAFVEGLAGQFRFVTLDATRRFGKGRESKLNVTNGWYFGKQLLRWLLHLVKDRPDVAHYAVTSGWAFLKCLVFLKLARKLGTRTLGHLHGGGFIKFWSGLPAWQQARARRGMLRLDGLVVLSEGWRGALREAVGLPDEMLFVVNNPIEREFETAALAMPVERGSARVLSMGVMDRAKGVFDILDARALLKREAGLEFVLAGPEREKGISSEVLARITSTASQDRVTVKGAVWGAEKLALFRDSSIFLLPSYFENFPLVLLEAAASGMAIITTPVGAVPEFLEPEVSAIFVEAGNHPQIAEAVARLAGSPEERARLGQAARQRYLTQLGRPRIMKSLESTYQQVLAQPRK